MPAEENPYKVKIEEIVNTQVLNKVVFDVTPELSERRSVSYSEMKPVHLPGDFQVYGNSGPRTFSLQGVMFISRTPQEADRNIKRQHILRGWQMPSFGTASGASEILGEPPPTLYLSAYTDTNSDARHQAHMRRISVVLTDLGFSYPADVNYIYSSANNVPMPTILQVDIVLKETHSPLEYASFSLEDYKNGRLQGF